MMPRYKTQEYARESQLKSNYGITSEIYEAYLDAQNHRCAICGKHESEFSRKLFVDHCHKTGKVRGLLCYKCNSGLGMFADDIDTLSIAISYLKERSEYINEK